MTTHLGPYAFAVATLTITATSSSQSFQFEPPPGRTPESLCTTPENIRGGMVAGDVTGDGLPDLVCSTGVSLLTMVQRPGGTFVAEGRSSSVGTRQPLLRDLDADGDLDLVMGPISPLLPTTMSTYLRGPLGWARLTMPAEANAPLQGLDVGDIDNDGDADILMAPLALQALIVLRNQGGSFVADPSLFQASLPSGVWPRFFDFDRDGDLDVVGSYRNGGLVWLRQQNGTFVNITAAMPGVRAPLQRHLLGDLTGDGIPDVLLHLANGDLDLLRGPDLRLQQAIGHVQDAVDLLLPDLDGDGDRDVVVARGALGLDVLFAQNGALTRAEGIDEGVLTAATGDFDGNGTDEAIVVLSRWPGNVLAVANGARSSLDAAIEIGLQPSSLFDVAMPVFGDFDGDGFVDVIQASNQTTGEPARMLFGRGDGTHRVRLTEVPIPLSGIRVIDIDGDGDLDLVGWTGPGLTIQRNSGSGTFVLEAYPYLLVDGFDNGDVDGDGDVDIVVRERGGVQLLLNQGPTFVTQTITTSFAIDAVLGDFDVDGDLDLAMLTLNGTCQVFENNGTGAFLLNPLFSIPVGPLPNGLLAGDFDQDGDVDLAIGDDITDLRVLLNSGGRNFSSTTLPSSPVLHPTQLADIDEDGHLDLIAYDRTTARGIHVLLGNGTGGFTDVTTPRVQPLVAFGSSRIVAAAVDADDDGDLDLEINVDGVLRNRLRDLTVQAAPHVGAITTVEVASGPGFSATGVAFVAYASARTARPLEVPGFAGFLHLDPASTVIAAAAPISTIGVTNAFLAVPPTQALVGHEFWLQAAIATQNGLPGFTNARRERILR